MFEEIFYEVVDGFRCTVCGETFESEVAYCDGSLDCAMSDGESLVPFTGTASFMACID